MLPRCFRTVIILLAATSVSEFTSPAFAQPALPTSVPALTGSQPPPAAQTNQLAPIVVHGERYVDPFEPMPGFGFRLDLPWPEFPSFSYETSPLIVSAARAPQAPRNVASTAYVLLAEPLRAEPALTLDGILRSVPGSGLSQRSDSFSASSANHVGSLRSLGPGSANRALVLLDGVPLNDSFGGWVPWAKVPRDALARIEVVPGGGATVWGNSAVDGVVQFFTRRVRGERVVVRVPPPPGSPRSVEGKVVWGTCATLHTRAEIGDFGTRSLEFSAVYPNQLGTLQLLSRMFATDGFKLVAPERRGPIDIAAWSRHRWLTARWNQPLGRDVEFTVTVRGFEEHRGDGTPYQKNGSREKFASLAFAGQIGLTFRWDAVAYFQDQSSASTVSTVNLTRRAETPVGDQFAVPATALGASWIGTWKHEGNSSVNSPRSSLGADMRFVRGETRENFNFTAGNFTQQRVAGGAQFVAGFFGLHERSLSDGWRATVGVRLDTLSDTDGRRRETDRISGAVLRDDRYHDLSEVQFSPSAGLVWTPRREWRARASVQQAFRRPTLNELYRLDRVGPNLTEANSDLRTERVLSAEIGVEWTFFALRPPAPVAGPVTWQSGRSSAPPPAKPRPPVSTPVFTASATVFHNDLRDAVGDVMLSPVPAIFPLFGPGIAGEVRRHRLNFDLTRVRGLNLSAKWTPWHPLTITGDYIYNGAAVRRAVLAPWLVGNRVARVPRQSALLGATWRAPAKLRLMPRLRYLGRQFEDIENRLTLGRVVIADLGISRALNPNIELFLTAENLANARIETGRSADGVVNVGTPRLVVGGLRGSW